MMRYLIALVFIFSNVVFSKTNVVSRAPEFVKALPTDKGAKITWAVNLPDTVLSFNNGKPYGIWNPHVNQALGCIFDLSEFPNATLEQIDFLHYSRQKMYGPYYYNILFFDMDSSILFYRIDSLLAGDSFEIPRFEVGVSLGSIPARPHVGIFIEGLSSPDGVSSFPALMTDSSDYIPGLSYYLADVNDPFLESDPNYTNFYELKDVDSRATNLVLDLWININGDKANKTDGLSTPPAVNLSYLQENIFTGIIDPFLNMSAQTSKTQSVIDGFYVYRGDTTGNQLELLAEVGSDVREFVDTNPLTDSSYFYAVASFNDLTTSIKRITLYFQPPILTILQARKDDNGDFTPDFLNKVVALRGTVVSPNFGSNVQYFINDAQAGILLYSSKFSLDLKMGDSLFVFGKVAQFNGLTEMLLDSALQIQVIGQKKHLPVQLTLAEVGEANEGRLAFFKNLRIINPAEWPAEGQNSSSIKVTDGQDTVALFIDKDTDLDGWTPPSESFNLTAIVDQYTKSTPANNGYELRPRSQSDFTPPTALENQIQGVMNFDLKACYPNPFNPSTTIKYSLATNSKVLIQVFNIQGQRIQTILNEKQTAGLHSVKFNGTGLPSGVYFVFFQAGKYRESQKIVLIK